MLYAFIKNNFAMNILVFDENNPDNQFIIDTIVADQGYDTAVELTDPSTPRYSSWDGEKFTPPTPQQLFELGVFGGPINEVHEHTGEELSNPEPTASE